MQIEFKLFATLMGYLPDGAVKNAITLDVAENTTPYQLIDTYCVPRSEVHLVLINGVYVDEAGRDRPLKSHDTLAIWPPVAGG
ncbi:MoaD/ThiS family protein [Candidatus Spongiihabitans sp.]|uniref:MoaD/ThiS family protein n=1 Tax=Candidatus Spongiihabitans sp. TaxID=3101308 RepID=UPI003C6F0147